MLPSVARSRELFSNEQKIYMENRKQQKNIIQNLAKLQHDGIPTRLLDFTTDPLVALFFATQTEERTDASIYLFIRNGYESSSLEVKLSSFVATQANRCLKDLVKKFNEENDVSLSIKRAKQILSQGIFIRPDTISDNENYRMREQKGTFAIPGNRIENGNISAVVPFENDLSYEEIVVPFEYQEEIRNELVQRGYTRERLLGESSKPIRYNSLPQDNVEEVKGKYINKAYLQYSITIEMTELMTVKEIEECGYRIAKESGADSVRIWFRRMGAKDGNHIMRQHWYKPSINVYGWGGSEYKGLKIIEERGDSYIVYDYLRSDWDRIKYKHLPIDSNAKLITLDVSIARKNQLVIETNLINGTELLLSYRVDDGVERTVKFIVKGTFTKIDIGHGADFSKITGEIIMPVPAVQNEIVRKEYGIDYEKIVGNFIQRSDRELTAGHKRFELNL